MNRVISNRHQPEGVPVPHCAVMIKGLAADLHISRNLEKRKTCPLDVGIDLIPGHTDPTMTQMENGVLFTVDTFINLYFGLSTFGYLCERSSTLAKLGGARVRAACFDPGYTGPVLIQVHSALHAWEKTLEMIKEAQKRELALAQILVLPYFVPVFMEWDDKKVIASRGNRGFGSTDPVV